MINETVFESFLNMLFYSQNMNLKRKQFQDKMKAIACVNNKIIKC